MPLVIGKCLVRFSTATRGSPLVLSEETTGSGGVATWLKRPPSQPGPPGPPTSCACPLSTDGKRRDVPRPDPRARVVPCYRARTGEGSEGGKHSPSAH